jgi:hypothetical protein
MRRGVLCLIFLITARCQSVLMGTDYSHDYNAGFASARGAAVGSGRELGSREQRQFRTIPRTQRQQANCGSWSASSTVPN